MQTTMNEAPTTARAGMFSNMSAIRDVLSRIVSTRKMVEITFTPANAEHYIITVDGTNFDYLSDGSATAAEIVAGLKALINAGSKPVTAVDGSAASKLAIIGDDYDTDFTVAIGAGTTPGNSVLATLVPFQQGAPFGLFACVDENETQGARLPRQASDITSGRGLGVLRYDSTQEQARGATVGVYPVGGVADIVRRGEVWVVTESDVDEGDAAYVRFAAGAGGTQLGSFRGDADTASAAALAGATFRSAASAGDLVKLELSP